MSKFTPGPWKWSETLLISQESPHEVILRLHPYFAVNDTDARLIAAAPELLEALELAVQSMHAGTEIAQKARAAIVKAKGES